jgi:tripartite-type tricarboxylate transporter receptor subunit TctC
MTMLRRSFLAAAAALAGLAVATGASAQAQNWPTKPVRIIVPFAPGGTSDTLGRVVAEQLSETFKQQFVVENRGGAGGITGSAIVAKAAPDGYTLVVSGVANHVIAPAINPAVSYDPLKDFVELAKASNTKMSYGSPGAGTNGHLLGEAFAQKAGIAMEHIAYKGASAAMTDVIAGHIPASSNTFATAAAHIRSGAVRPLAVSSPQRLKGYPDIPTFKEQGYPDLVATIWFGLSGPAGMPKEIVDKLNAEVTRILVLPQVVERLERDAITPDPLTAAQFADFVKSETEKWGPIAKASGAQPE